MTGLVDRHLRSGLADGALAAGDGAALRQRASQSYDRNQGGGGHQDSLGELREGLAHGTRGIALGCL